MKLKPIAAEFSVCQPQSICSVRLDAAYCFLSRTDEELSLVCETADVPDNCLRREDGWRAFRIEGVLDFSLIGILSRISSILAENGIGIFAVSTYNTDYIFTKQDSFEKALGLLSEAGYSIV